MSARPSLRLEFYRDPAEFLAVAGAHLGKDPVIGTVVTTIAHRALARREEGIAPSDRDWWLVVHDDAGAVVGAGMRTATFAPYPAFLLPMAHEAALALARSLHEWGEEVGGVNGALPAAEVCATELARLRGGRVEVSQHVRLHELAELTLPASVPGELVAATAGDLELVTQWFAAFMGDADEQVGRPRGASAHDAPDRSELLRRVRTGDIWFWIDESGRPVHLTAATPASFGVARVGPVYTPPDQRGRGWACNAVAEVSRRLQARGARVCLFTDQANPTSNKIYAALGYRPVVDMANLVIV